MWRSSRLGWPWLPSPPHCWLPICCRIRLPTSCLVIAGLVFYVVILALLRRRLVSLAAWILVGYFIVCPLLGSLINNDVQASPLFLPLSVVVAACVLPPRQVVITAVLAFAEIAAMTTIDGPDSILVSDMLTYAAIAMLVTSAAAVVLSLAIARALRAADQSTRPSAIAG